MKNPLKQKLKNNELTIGSWITLPSTDVVEIMCKAGFDWLCIDIEHSVIGFETMQNQIRVIEKCGLVPLVRVSKNDETIIKRVMDAGAYGVIVPMVNTWQDAEKAIAAVKYPPVGTRGVGLARAQGYGMKFDEYAETVNDESVVIVQIEHIDAVYNLRTILNTNGVDGCIIGPYDLSASLGVPGQFDNPKVVDAIEKVEKICKEMFIPLGFHVIQPCFTEAIDKFYNGYRFIAFSLDTLFLVNKCTDEMENLRVNI